MQFLLKITIFVVLGVGGQRKFLGVGGPRQRLAGRDFGLERGGVIWNHGTPPPPPAAKGGKMKFSL